MISDSQIRYGSRVLRQGRSRRFTAYQSSNARRNDSILIDLLFFLPSDMIPGVKRLLLLLLAIVLAGGVAFSYYPPFRVLSLVTVGRSPLCSWSQALDSGENLRRQVQYKDEILNASRLVQDDPKGFELWDTPSGQFWIPQASRYMLPFNLAEQRRKIYGTGEFGPHTGDIVLDCGANIGVTVREELAAGASKIVAIEPAPENLESLRRNFAREIESGRVVVYPKGVWDKDDFLTLRVDPKNSGADTFVLQHAGVKQLERVPLTTIDKLVAELNLARVDYIKMDVEGSEPKALSGARETLGKYKPRISVSSNNSTDAPRVIPPIVRAARPDYQMFSGPCEEQNYTVQPDVLYFK
jgi:FkbM family methyltransferase